MVSVEQLQERWNDLYKTHLPALARAKDPVQPVWPVQLDHCFARIVLDNAIGKDRQWNQVLKSPAYKHMSKEQLEDAIDLGEKLATGQEDLVRLDERSLELRGKASKTSRVKAAPEKHGDSKVTRKRKSNGEAPHDAHATTMKKQKQAGTVSSYFLPPPKSEQEQTRAAEPASPPSRGKRSRPSKKSDGHQEHTTRTNPITEEQYPDRPPHDLISDSTELTPFRKEVLTLLCSVPRGRYTTYQAMSDHITSTSHKTCARAIGNAMRNNPFAPVVPCHRVLASGGSIGGFGGHWGEEGKYASRKREMLREEGVKFDGRGKVVGSPFTAFT